MTEQPIAVLSGGSSGLGKAMAVYLQSRGFYVITISRRAPEEGIGNRHIAVDLTNGEQRRQLVAELSSFPHLDLLINNAGVGAYATWAELSEADLRRLCELDFFAPVLLTRDLLPLLRRSRATVVNISSAAGLLPVACMGAYSAAKAALRMFSETLRTEERQIRVLTVCPGRIDTGFSSRAFGSRQVPDTPKHDSATPERLAKAVYRAYKRHRRTLIYPRWYAWAISWLSHFPSWYESASRKVWKL